MSRIAPVQAPYEPDVDRLLTSMMPSGVAPIGLFRTFARNISMTTALRGWGGYELGPDLSLGMRDREIVIDRTCVRCGAEYEWGVHVAFFADRADLSSDQITSLVHGDSTDACWTSARDRALIDAVDALHDDADLTDELWARLAVHLDDEQLLDLLLLTGWYHAISYVARAARVELEPGAPRFSQVANPPG